MKEQAAYSLLTLAGKKATKADVKALLTASGCKADDEALDKFFALLDNSKKEVHELIQAGSSKLVSMPSGGARAAGPTASAGAAPAQAKEEKKEEVEEVDMGNLFGGDDEY